jgi:hypothetical protein
MDQHADSFECALLLHLYADWAAYASSGQGSYAAHYLIRSGNVPRRASIASRFTHAASILIIQKRDKHMLEFVLELWGYLKERKKFWLLPIIIASLLLGVLIVLTQGTAIAPFIYTLF